MFELQFLKQFVELPLLIRFLFFELSCFVFVEKLFLIELLATDLNLLFPLIPLLFQFDPLRRDPLFHVRPGFFQLEA